MTTNNNNNNTTSRREREEEAGLQAALQRGDAMLSQMLDYKRVSYNCENNAEHIRESIHHIIVGHHPASRNDASRTTAEKLERLRELSCFFSKQQQHSRRNAHQRVIVMPTTNAIKGVMRRQLKEAHVWEWLGIFTRMLIAGAEADLVWQAKEEERKKITAAAMVLHGRLGKDSVWNQMDAHVFDTHVLKVLFR